MGTGGTSGDPICKLLSNGEGCPVAVEVFAGNTADPKTVAAQVQKLGERFHLERIILVGDRGTLTQKRIAEDLREPEGLQWITALRTPQIQTLVAQGAIQMSFFDEQDLAEITHPDYPGERLMVCRNPLLASERARKCRELIAAAEKKLKEEWTRSATWWEGRWRPARWKSIFAGRQRIRSCIGNEIRNASSVTPLWMASMYCGLMWPARG